MSRYSKVLLAVGGMLLAAACVDDPVNIDPPSTGDDAGLDGASGVSSRSTRNTTQETFAVIDAHESLPGHFTNPQALVEAIRGAGGVALIGVKPEGAPRYTERVTGSPGASVATVFRVGENEMLAARRELRSAGAEVLRTFRSLPIVVAGVDPEQAPRLDSLPFVDYMEPNLEYNLAIPEGSPGATRASALPGQTTPENIRKVRAESAWGVTDGEGAWVVFLDGGLVGGASGHHPDLVPVDECWSTHSRVDATDCTDDLASWDVFYSHGTKVAGVAIAEDNNSHVVGVAPGVDDWGMVRVCAPVCDWDAGI